MQVAQSNFDRLVTAPSNHEILTRFSSGEKTVAVTLQDGTRATLVRHIADVIDPPGGHLFPEDDYFRVASDWRREGTPTRIQTTVLVFDGGVGGPAALETAARAAMASYQGQSETVRARKEA